MRRSSANVEQPGDQTGIRRALEEEFAIANELIGERVKAKLNQAQVAKRMGTSQSAVARIASGRSPSLNSLRRYAKAVGCKLEIRLKAS